MRIGRREFMGSVAAGATGLLAGCRDGVKVEPKPVAPPMFNPYETVRLGLTKLRVSLVGLGTGMRGWMRQSNQTRMGQKAFTRLIRGAFDRGIRWFDLADLYGTHPYFAESMKAVDRGKYTIVSKIWWGPRGVPDRDRPDADVMVGRFLKQLKTDYIDLVQLHCVTSAKWPTELRKQMDILARLKDKGVIRAHGVSCHSLEALQAAADEAWTDCVHARINPFGLRTDGPMEKVMPVVKKLHKAGKGVIGMKIIGEGKIGHSDVKRDQSVSFALGSGCVHTLVVGFEKLEEIDDLAARVRKVKRPVV